MACRQGDEREMEQREFLFTELGGKKSLWHRLPLCVMRYIYDAKGLKCKADWSESCTHQRVIHPGRVMCVSAAVSGRSFLCSLAFLLCPWCFFSAYTHGGVLFPTPCCAILLKNNNTRPVIWGTYHFVIRAERYSRVHTFTISNLLYSLQAPG